MSPLAEGTVPMRGACLLEIDVPVNFTQVGSASRRSLTAHSRLLPISIYIVGTTAATRLEVDDACQVASIPVGNGQHKVCGEG